MITFLLSHQQTSESWNTEENKEGLLILTKPFDLNLLEFPEILEFESKIEC
jgi:hypothetical protein